MSKYQRNFMLEEEELNTEEEIGTLPENAPAEEKTFYKRYADLRRHSQAKEAEFKKTIDGLQAKVDELARTSADLPTSEDEIETWVKKYPDVAKIVMGIARKQASVATADLDERVRKLDERELTLAKEAAQAELQKRHPDFFTTIRSDPEFLEWLEEQSEADQKALYDNDTDWRAASRVIADYKYEKGITNTAVTTDKKERRDTRSDAMRDTSVRGGSTPSGSRSYVFTESQISKMSVREYEANEEAIDKAQREGKILMDITG